MVGGISGTRASVSSISRELLWGGPGTLENMIIAQDAIYSSAIADSGSTPTTDIRAGTIVGTLTSSGELEEWDADAADGTEFLSGVVGQSFSTLDAYGTAEDKDIPMGRIIRAPLKASQLLIQGTALTSHADEFLARRYLVQMGCILDDDPAGYKTGLVQRFQNKATDYTVLEADNGSTFFAHTADATFTLPAIHAALRFEFVRLDNFEMVVTSAEGDNVIGANDASGDSVTFTTTGEQIGAYLCFESVYANGTLKWLYFIKKVAFSTDDYLVSAFAT